MVTSKILHYLRFKENLSFDLLKKIKKKNPNLPHLNKLETLIHNYRFILDEYFKSGGSISVIPRDKKLTDLVSFEHLKGTEFTMNINAPKSGGVTELKRNYDDLRGIHSASTTAFGLETLIEEGEGIKLRTPIHELGHVLECVMKLKDSEFSNSLTKLFNEAKKRNLFLTDYSRFNSKEYFAEGVVAYLNDLPDPDFSIITNIDDAGMKTQKNRKLYGQFITKSELYTKDFELYKLIDNAFSAVKKNKGKFS